MIRIKEITLILAFLLSCSFPPPVEEELRLAHEYHPNSALKERVPARFYSNRTDTVKITFFCVPENGRIEYHVVPVRNDTAETVSGIRCPRIVVGKAESKYGTYYDSLDVATIRKTIPDLRDQGE